MAFFQKRGWIFGGIIFIILGVGTIFLVKNFSSQSLYEGLITTMEVQSDEATRALARQRISTAQAAISAHTATQDESFLGDFYSAIASDALILGDLVLARESLEASLQINALNGAVWSSYGFVLVSMHDYDSALSAYLRAVELAPREETYRDAIRLLEQQFSEQQEKIKTLYKDSVDVLGQKRFNMLGLARWYARAKDCIRAEDHFSVAEDLAESEEIRQQIREESREVLSACKKQDE